MGCSGSRPDADDDTPPQGLNPFRRRIDEIRQRRSGRAIIKDDTLSSKQLLHDKGEDGHHSPCPTDAPYCEIRMSFSSPSDSDGVGSGKGQSSKPKMDATTEVPLPHHGSSTHENDHNENNNNNNNNTMESDKPEKEKKGREMEKDDRDGEDEEHGGKREKDESSSCGGGADDDEGDPYGEGEGGYLDGDDRRIGPGSPSFRDYFVSSAANAANTDLGDAGNGEDRSAGEKRELPPSERKESNSGSSEELVVKSMKKENKGRRFKNVLPKGKQGGVKNLLKVRSCYHTSNTSDHGKVNAS